MYKQKYIVSFPWKNIAAHAHTSCDITVWQLSADMCGGNFMMIMGDRREVIK